MKIGVIGAGPSGLSAIKNCLSLGCEVIAFEQTNQIGGTWVLTEETEKDKNGLEVHSSMYESLRTNIPKEIMEFPNFAYKTPDASYIAPERVLEYLKSYAEAFDLEKHIKFENQVVRVCPGVDKSWEFIVLNLVTNTYQTYVFQTVFVCNGFSFPSIPKFPGQDTFKGKQTHAHNYRNARSFVKDRVLVIGGGPSGNDLTVEIGKVAEKVFWSNHIFETYGRKIVMKLPESVIEKRDVLRFTENGAEFVDGSFEEFSTIVFCTGYEFRFPFLSIDSGLSCHDNYVYPLYKHCININRPSLAIIGLPFFAIGTPLLDLQVRFCLEFMTGRKQLPSREEMLRETEAESNERWKTLPKKKAHFLGLERHEKYYEDLSKAAEIEPVQPVIAKIFKKSVENIFTNYAKFRDFNFKIIDDENFVMTSV